MSMRKPLAPLHLAAVALCTLISFSASAADWPMWRHDASRSAASPEELAPELHLRWVREYPPLQPAWEDPVNQDRMPFDCCYEPVVAGTRMFIASNRTDSVTALDTRTGRELWSAVTDGPVRLPPVAVNGRVFAASDDGFLYCFDDATGALRWRFRGGPDARKVIGNSRLISAWPARGGPVVADGGVYFGASIWPFMGTFIHALREETGEVLWSNDGLGSAFMNQPHGGSVSFGGVAPQGAFAVSGDRLLVPCGRSVPACLDRRTGELLYYHLYGSPMLDVGGSANRKLEGGSHVSATGSFYLNHRGIGTTLYDLQTGRAMFAWARRTYPVLDGGMCYLAGNPVTAVDLTKLEKVDYQTQVKDRKTRKVKTVTRQRWEVETPWECPVDGTRALIKAGSRLYAAGGNRITAIALPASGAPSPDWSTDVEGTVVRLIAADSALFAVTAEGRVYAFGTAAAEAHVHSDSQPPPPPLRPLSADAESVLLAAPARVGYGLAFGLRDGSLVEEILQNTELHIVSVDPRQQQVDRLRGRLTAAGFYGTRASVHVGDPQTFAAPPYAACLILSEDPDEVGLTTDSQAIERLFHSLRPYGGSAFLRLPSRRHRQATAARIRGMQLPGAQVDEVGPFLRLSRVGPLAGAGAWTHLHGDVANTTKSDDQLVKLPLGLLWFGGSTHHDVLPRHGHGPTEQVVGGRLFIEGINMLSARDVYTGKPLWKRTFEHLGTSRVYYDDSYKPDPLDTSYNQRHAPGANARGTNYVATEDSLYLALGSLCLMLSPESGETRRAFRLPPLNWWRRRRPDWGYLGVSDDLLVATAGFARFSDDPAVKAALSTHFDTTSGEALVVLNRHTGSPLWSRRAAFAFRHNAIAAGGGKLFCIDALPAPVLSAQKRRGETTDAKPSLLALDIRTGTPAWSTSEGVFGTWLAYSSEHDLLVQSGRRSRDMLPGEPSDRIIVYRAGDGSVLWDRQVKHGGPIMLHGDTIYFNAVSSAGEAVSLLTGDKKTFKHPLTGQEAPWAYHRRYGCNSVVASQNLLTFRSGAAGFYDLATMGGTGNFGGFKSGCTANLIAADGVLNAPDYTRTCTCSYQNQTSLALVHMPDVEVWTFNDYRYGKSPIQRVGINFGAPGDRRASNGTLWLDFPSVGGPSPDIPVRVAPEHPAYYRRHSSHLERGGQRWIAASGVLGLECVTLTLAPPDDGFDHVVAPIASSADDVEEAGGNIRATSSDLELVLDGVEQLIALRFAAVDLSQGAKVARATIQFTVDEATDEPTRLEIAGEAADTSAPLTSGHPPPSARERTQAKVAWDVPPWPAGGKRDKDQQTPDLTAVIQEIVDRPGWTKGSRLTLLIGGSGKRVACAYDGSPDTAPVLHVALERPPLPSTGRTAPEPTCTVRLHFAEIEHAREGRRVFDVALQGKEVLRRFDIAREAGGPRKAVVREFRGVSLTPDLAISFRAEKGVPLLSGVEVVADGDTP